MYLTSQESFHVEIWSVKAVIYFVNIFIEKSWSQNFVMNNEFCCNCSTSQRRENSITIPTHNVRSKILLSFLRKAGKRSIFALLERENRKQILSTITICTCQKSVSKNIFHHKKKRRIELLVLDTVSLRRIWWYLVPNIGSLDLLQNCRCDHDFVF